jgi:hypothetical protein
MGAQNKFQIRKLRYDMQCIMGAFCKKMYLRVKEDGDPVTAHMNDGPR